ncbi:MAG: hypothetical protein ABI947_30065 [Chloroflexota bacterium]
MTNQPPKKSLAEELKRRKTQEIQRAAETKRMTQVTGAVPPSKPSIPAPVDPKRTSQASQPNRPQSRATQTSPQAGQPTRSKPSIDPRRATKTTSVRRPTGNTIPDRLAALNQRQKVTLAVSGLLILLICVGTYSFTANQPPPPIPTAVALPTNTANNVLDYIKNAGVPIENLKTLTVPDNTWKATQAVQFNVRRGTDSGQFIFLSYDSLTQAEKDAFRAGLAGNFQKWKVVQFSNIVMLISPDTTQPISDELNSHFMSFLVRPYRDFLPTITPTPAPTSPAAATAAPTSKR